MRGASPHTSRSCCSLLSRVGGSFLGTLAFVGVRGIPFVRSSLRSRLRTTGPRPGSLHFCIPRLNLGLAPSRVDPVSRPRQRLHDPEPLSWCDLDSLSSAWMLLARLWVEASALANDLEHNLVCAAPDGDDPHVAPGTRDGRLAHVAHTCTRAKDAQANMMRHDEAR